MDIKPVLSNYAKVQYLTKYCTKSEPSSDTLKNFTEKLPKHSEDTSKQLRSMKVFNCAMVASVGERDVTA